MLFIGELIMELNKNEGIESWTVVVRTTEDRELSFEDLGLEIYYTISKPIDETLEALYPCEWADDDPCKSCKKLGETVCGNDTQYHQCFEPIQ